MTFLCGSDILLLVSQCPNQGVTILKELDDIIIIKNCNYFLWPGCPPMHPIILAKLLYILDCCPRAALPSIQLPEIVGVFVAIYWFNLIITKVLNFSLFSLPVNSWSGTLHVLDRTHTTLQWHITVTLLRWKEPQRNHFMVPSWNIETY